MEKATNDAQKWFYPSGPIPERGRSTFFSISDDGKKLIYPGSHHVMIVDINNPAESYAETRHVGKVTCARKAANGNLVASADTSGNVYVWDMTDPEAMPSFQHEYGPIGKKIKDISFLPEDRRIAVVNDGVAGGFGNVFNYKKDIITEGTFLGQTNETLSVTLPNNSLKMCYTCGQDNTVIKHKFAPSSNSGSDKSHKNFVNCIRASPDGTSMISVSTDCCVAMWKLDGEDSAPVVKKNAHAGTIYCCEWFPDSKRYVTSSADKTVKVWDFASGDCLADLKVAEKPTLNDMQVGVTCCESTIVSLSLSGQFNVWNVDTIANGKFPDKVLNFHTSPVSFTFGNDKLGYTVEKGGRILIFDSNDAVKSYNFGKTATAAHLHGDTVYIASYAELFKANFETGQLELVCKLHSSGQCMAHSGDDLFVGGGKGGVTKVTGGKDTKRAVVCSAEKGIRGMVMTKGGMLVTCDEAGTVHWVDPNSLEVKRTYRHASVVKWTSLAGSDEYVAAGDSNGQIHVLKADGEGDVECVKVLKYGGTMVTSLSFDTSGDKLFSTSLDCSVTGWDIKELKIIEQYQNVHSGNINCSDWCAPRGILMTGGDDGCIKGWSF